MNKILESLLSEEALSLLNDLSEDEINSITLSDLQNRKKVEEVLPENWQHNDQELCISLSDVNEKTWYKTFFEIQDYLMQHQEQESVEGINLSFNPKEQNLTINISGVTDRLVQDLAKGKQDGKVKLESKEETVVIDFERGIKCLSEDSNNTYRVKIPIAQIGTWKHGIYGTLNYTKESLSELENNIKERVVGFEAPLFIGHPEDKEGGAPAEGFLLSTHLDENILYGVWETNESIYKDIKKGKYRYSSSEFITKFKDKVSGKNKGLVLVGMALTNRPFIPNLPKVIALNNKEEYNNNVTMLTFDYSRYNNVNIETNHESEQNNMNQENEKNVVENATKQEIVDNISDKQAFMDELNVKVNLIEETYKQQLSEVIEQNKLLQQRVEKFEKKEAEQALAQKIDFVNKLSLPQETKQEYVELLRENKLGLAEETVLKSLKNLSDKMGVNMLSQYGSSYDTENLNDVGYEDPYKDVIEKNKKIAESLNSLSGLR